MQLQIRHPLLSGSSSALRAEGRSRARNGPSLSDPARHAGERASWSNTSLLYEGSATGEFLTQAARETEITGPVAAKLFFSSASPTPISSCSARVHSEQQEVTYQGALTAHPYAHGAPRGHGSRSLADAAYRRDHTPDRDTPLAPGKVYELDVEVWATSIVVPAGHRVGLTVRGRDYEYPGGPSAGLGTLGAVFTGVGPFKHDDPHDRPPEIFGKTVTIHCGPDRRSRVLLPIIPGR